MRRFLVTLLAVSLIALSFSGPAAARSSFLVNVFVAFHGTPNPGLIRSAGGQVSMEYRYLPVIAALLPEASIRRLQQHPTIRYIEPDGLAYATNQSMPWGVSRIGAPEVWCQTTGLGVKVAVLDTGIDGGHTDVVVAGGTSFVPGTSWQDDNGHGTHVADTIAADNSQDIVGVDIKRLSLPSRSWIAAEAGTGAGSWRASNGPWVKTCKSLT
ncbi:MAG: S8 family serine peptidase [Bacillota bacterium]